MRKCHFSVAKIRKMQFDQQQWSARKKEKMQNHSGQKKLTPNWELSKLKKTVLTLNGPKFVPFDIQLPEKPDIETFCIIWILFVWKNGQISVFENFQNYKKSSQESFETFQLFTDKQRFRFYSQLFRDRREIFLKIASASLGIRVILSGNGEKFEWVCLAFSLRRTHLNGLISRFFSK